MLYSIFGGVNLFNEPQKAISEFVRAVKSKGIISWGDEGFSKNYPDNIRKKILSKINPGYLKPRPSVPDDVTEVKEYEVYGGMAYLVVCKKKINNIFEVCNKKLKPHKP